MKELRNLFELKKAPVVRIAPPYLDLNYLKIIDKKTPSILLVTLVYFIYYWNSVYNSIFYNSTMITAYALILIIIQFLIFLMYKKNKYLNIITIVFFTASIVFWHGAHVVNWINNWQIIKFKHQIIRGRLILIFFSSILFLLEYIIHLKKPILIYAQNVFLGILCMLLMIFNFKTNTNKRNIHSFNNGYLQINTIERKNESKPIVLILTDEYNSPNDLVTFFKDSSIGDFSKHLKKNGWVIKNSFYSNEISTIHSLSSMFNFNLSNSKLYSSVSINEIGSEKLMKAELSDSLGKRNVEILNYGIFDFGKSKPINRLYYYPKNLLETVVYNSIYPFVFNNTGELKIEGFQNSYYPMEKHNKFIFNTLIDTLISSKNKKQFVYVHLFMPHAPMVYDNTFKFRDNNLENYLAFWKFTNNKLYPLLDSIIKLNKYRIILTGDHGYRSSMKNIDPHYTFGAFYGFDENDVHKILSVQDLGSLINNYLKD